jgi:hypothetical protein
MVKSLGICILCRSKFEVIVEGQKFCSGTCARAVRDVDELGRVYAELDRRHAKAFQAQKENENVHGKL